MNEARRGVTALVRAGRKVREVPLPLTVLARRGAVADVFFFFLFFLSLSVPRSQGLEVEAGAPVASPAGSAREAAATSEGEPRRSLHHSPPPARPSQQAWETPCSRRGTRCGA